MKDPIKVGLYIVVLCATIVGAVSVLARLFESHEPRVVRLQIEFVGGKEAGE